VPRVALATCAEVAEGDEDSPALMRALAARGVEARPAVWDDASVDWAAFDLVVVRSTWDYAERRDAFLAWAASLPRVLNQLQVLRWNTDKHYLAEFERAGVPVVPTRFLEPGQPFEAPARRFVVKPAISAGSRHSASYEPDQAGEAGEHVARLHAMGRTMMVQPYLKGIDSGGETALVYLGGAYSHTVRKAALLQPGQPPGDALYLEEQLEPAEPSEAERAVAEAALRAAPDGLLYARVDLVQDVGTLIVLEVELTEPSLWLGYAQGAADRFADAIAGALEPHGDEPPSM
jgi:glutathione synthase/RimK-type ligase-like ATP-grasp enzyme